MYKVTIHTFIGPAFCYSIHNFTFNYFSSDHYPPPLLHSVITSTNIHPQLELSPQNPREPSARYHLKMLASVDFRIATTQRDTQNARMIFSTLSGAPYR